ncbi:DUF3316 domain-containing protein [Photobacterium chitinilyticum]|uniref:DUF3316 domain-containing protein n=1 Tax=Photobacterium chitinilyticum TaxID=2485123 RepID=A0A3S3RA03_9GAMM|nr:DUF3316 domain-containing protein [Photobacterium chitinilyticum]RWX55838.1 DUF3316 domain-containing protein [Photobacterium chitinilyticum]
MKKLLASSLLIFFSALSVADHFVTLGNYRFQTGTSTFRTDYVEHKKSAYQEGYTIMADINSQKSFDLSRSLRVPPSRLDVRSIKIDNSYVMVRELSRVPGQIEYQGIVIVNYHYRVRESRN